MIQKQSRLNVADNSGAKSAQCIGVPGRTGRSCARVGDVITVSIKKATPTARVKKGEVMKALIVRTTSAIRRPDGTSVRFDDNAVVLINAQGEPISTRVVGAIAREIRARGYTKVVSLAMEVL